MLKAINYLAIIALIYATEARGVNFDLFCGKGRGEFEKFIAAASLSPILSTGFLELILKLPLI